MLRLLALLGVAATAGALDNGLGRTPQMGWNSWNCYGGGVTAADLKATADFFVSSGLRDAGWRQQCLPVRPQRRRRNRRQRQRAHEHGCGRHQRVAVVQA